MRGNLNEKYHNIFFTNAVFKVAMLCTISVLQFVLLPPSVTRKHIVLLVKGAYRSRGACSSNPMIVTGENWSNECSMIHHNSQNCSGIELSKPGTVQTPPFILTMPQTVKIADTPAAARWLSVHLWASGMLKVAQHTSCPSTCTFTFLHIATFVKSHIPPHTSAHKHGTKERYFNIVSWRGTLWTIWCHVWAWKMQFNS